MKLFDKAFDRVVELSKPVQTLAGGLKACAEGLEKLALNLAIVAQNQAIHHEMIEKMWAVNQIIMKKINTTGLDTSMPDPTSQNKTGEKKPN